MIKYAEEVKSGQGKKDEYMNGDLCVRIMLLAHISMVSNVENLKKQDFG